MLLANDSFLGRGGAGDVSLSHEARRTGFWCWVGWDRGSWRCISGSSSELAIASESGVERRFNLSRRIAWLLGATAGKPLWPGFGCGPCLMVVEFIVMDYCMSLWESKDVDVQKAPSSREVPKGWAEDDKAVKAVYLCCS